MEIRELQIGQQLSFVNSCDAINGLVFYNNSILHYHIYPVSGINLGAFIRNWKMNLNGNIKIALPQLISKTLLVCGLQQTWPKRTMNFNGRVNNLTRNILDIHRLYPVSNNVCCFKILRVLCSFAVFAYHCSSSQRYVIRVHQSTKPASCIAR